MEIVSNDLSVDISYALISREGMTYDWNGQSDFEVQASHLTDYEVAGRVRMLQRTDLNHESVCTLARDRIMGLSKEVARLESLIMTLRSKMHKEDSAAEYLETHGRVIRSSLSHLRGMSVSEANQTFYEHEIKALDEATGGVLKPKAGVGGTGGLLSTSVAYDLAGCPHCGHRHPPDGMCV